MVLQARLTIKDCISLLDNTKTVLVDFFVDVVNNSRAPDTAIDRSAVVARRTKANTATLAMLSKLEEKCASMRVRAYFLLLPHLGEVIACKLCLIVVKMHGAANISKLTYSTPLCDSELHCGRCHRSVFIWL